MSSSHCGDLIVPAVEASIGLLDRVQLVVWSALCSKSPGRETSVLDASASDMHFFVPSRLHPSRLGCLLGSRTSLHMYNTVSISMVEFFYSLRHAHKIPFCRCCLLGLEGKKATIPFGALLEVSGHCIAWALIYYGTSLACFPFLV
jgi:hypothetical protein